MRVVTKIDVTLGLRTFCAFNLTKIEITQAAKGA